MTELRNTDGEVLFRSDEPNVQSAFHSIANSRKAVYNIDLRDVDLSFLTFENCTIEDCNFERSNLTGTRFMGCRIIDCSFFNAYIEDAHFESTLIRTPGLIDGGVRSDGYRFYGIMYNEQLFIKAGCRLITIDDAIERWRNLSNYYDQFNNFPKSARKKRICLNTESISICRSIKQRAKALGYIK